MGTRHPKSPCCSAPIRRFGGRRRQCCACGRTWRVRLRHRGRKRHRLRTVLVYRTVGEKRTLGAQARQARLATSTVRKRFGQALSGWLAATPPPPIPPGDLVLLVDAAWYTLAHQPWTLYLMAFKPVAQSQAYFADPQLHAGRESAQAWDHVLSSLPLEVRERIIAMVSDGFRGSRRLAHRHGWVQQRCHFHLIAQLEARRGHVRRLPTAGLREGIYQTCRRALRTRSRAELARCLRRLRHAATHRDCPARLRMICHDVVGHVEAFRAYLDQPRWQLPTTTNVVESMVRRLRDRLRPLRTPVALQRWAVATIRLHPVLTCNGHQYQPD